MGFKVLVVEDEREISRILEEFLVRNEYSVTVASDGLSASQIMEKEQFDMILMDLMLPGKSGEELIRELRKFSDSPLIVISAKSALEARIEALRIGADDFILKPFELSEVLVRMEVVLRRAGKFAGTNTDDLSYKGLVYVTSENRALYKGKAVSLTAKELMMIRLFLKYPKKVFTKANLYESVWNEDYVFEDNTVNVHVSNLRSKLKKASGEDFIETVWGIGYKLKGD